MAQESDAQELTGAVLPEGFELLQLPGHFFHMVGFRSPDDVVYLADCLSSRETLDKYQIGFVYDVAAYLDTLEKVKTMQAAAFVPAHAEVTEDIAPLAQYNIDKVLEIADHMVALCAEPVIFEELLKKLFDDYSLTLTFEQYVLVGSTVKSYLAWLKDTRRCSLRTTACCGGAYEDIYRRMISGHDSFCCFIHTSITRLWGSSFVSAA